MFTAYLMTPRALLQPPTLLGLVLVASIPLTSILDASNAGLYLDPDLYTDQISDLNA